jgi:hypothetical protein
MQQESPSIQKKWSGGWQQPIAHRLVIQLGKEQRDVLEAVRKRSNMLLQPNMATDLNIVVGEFYGDTDQLTTMTRWMQRYFLQAHSFPLYLNNFSGIPPHELHMRVLCTADVGLIRSHIGQLNEYLRGYHLPVISQPVRWVLPLMEGLPGMLYDKALHYFSQLELALEVPVNALLLQQKLSVNSAWQLVERLPLQHATAPALYPWYAPLHSISAAR